MSEVESKLLSEMYELFGRTAEQAQLLETECPVPPSHHENQVKPQEKFLKFGQKKGLIQFKT